MKEKEKNSFSIVSTVTSTVITVVPQFFLYHHIG